CITFGHAPGYTLARMFSWLAPGGLLHLTVRRDFLDHDNDLQILLDGLRWERLDEATWVTCNDGQQMVGITLRKHS
ncbi:MAG: hypothetical protein ACPG4T_04355, partial [Nannocystaceae bacterium]